MAALRDPEQIKYLEPFLGKAVSVTEAAKLCSCKPNTMLSRIKRFEHLGLLRVVQTRKRNGRGIKLYTTTSDSFFVELNLDDIVFGHQRWSQHFVEMISSGLRYAYTETPLILGRRIFRNGSGTVQMDVASDEHTSFDWLNLKAPAFFSTGHDSLRLSFLEAKQLQQELHDLVARRVEKIDAVGEQRYLLWLNLIPIDETRPTTSD